MIKKIFVLWSALQSLALADAAVQDDLTPPEPSKEILTLHARGSQVYQCTFKNNEYSWELFKPIAELYDVHGDDVGRHSAGPVWQHKDGSRIVGKGLKRVDKAPLASIPWLLIRVVEQKGNGVFSKVNFIQRINTVGGLPPLSACNSNYMGDEKPIEYSADYVFFEPQGQ